MRTILLLAALLTLCCTSLAEEQFIGNYKVTFNFDWPHVTSPNKNGGIDIQTDFGSLKVDVQDKNPSVKANVSEQFMIADLAGKIAGGRYFVEYIPIDGKVGVMNVMSYHGVEIVQINWYPIVRNDDAFASAAITSNTGIFPTVMLANSINITTT